MKRLNETFTNKEFETLKKAKANKTWREWMLQAAHKQQNKHTEHTLNLPPCPGTPSDKTRLKTLTNTKKEVKENDEPHKNQNIRKKKHTEHTKKDPAV